MSTGAHDSGKGKGNGGAAIIRALEENGVRDVFGIPGTHNLELYRALAPSGIRHVLMRHEQGVGYAADGYARVSGSPGVCITTSGPGVANIAAAVGTAYADSVPLLVISPGVNRGRERADSGTLHEVKDQRAHMEAISAQGIRAADAAHAAAVIHEFFASQGRRRPRPLYLEVPVDVLESRCSLDEMPGPITYGAPSADPAALSRAAVILDHAERVAVVVGGGGREAGPHAVELSSRLGAVIVTTVNGKGAVDESHPASLGAAIRFAEVQRYLEEADALVLVGTEVAESDLWGPSLRPRGRVIRIDIDPAQAHKNVMADVALIAPAQEALASLAGLVAARAGGTATAAEEAARLRPAAMEAALADGAAFAELHAELRASLPDDTVLAGDSSQATYFGSVHFFGLSPAGRFIYPAGFATLGYGLPAAIGAKVADPERPVVAVVGDGAFLFSAIELASAADLGFGLPVVVANNHGFAEIREEMAERGMTPSAVSWREVDLPLLARACNGRGEVAVGAREVARLVEGALQGREPAVIEYPL